MKGWWTVRVDKHKDGPYRMFACPWFYMIVKSKEIKVGMF